MIKDKKEVMFVTSEKTESLKNRKNRNYKKEAIVNSRIKNIKCLK